MRQLQKIYCVLEFSHDLIIIGSQEILNFCDGFLQYDAIFKCVLSFFSKKTLSFSSDDVCELFFKRKRRYERSKKLSESLIKLLRNKSLIYTIKPTSSSAYKIQSNNDVNLDHKASIYANENEREKKFIHKKKSSKIPEVVLKSSFVSERRTHNFLFSIWIIFLI